MRAARESAARWSRIAWQRRRRRGSGPCSSTRSWPRIRPPCRSTGRWGSGVSEKFPKPLRTPNLATSRRMSCIAPFCQPLRRSPLSVRDNLRTLALLDIQAHAVVFERLGQLLPRLLGRGNTLGFVAEVGEQRFQGTQVVLAERGAGAFRAGLVDAELLQRALADQQGRLEGLALDHVGTVLALFEQVRDVARARDDLHLGEMGARQVRQLQAGVHVVDGVNQE